MKIAILNGSPRKENTAAMIEAFREGAEEAGHEVEVLHVGKMKINGCLACEYCHTKGEGKCIQKDDLEKIMPAYLESDMVVFASPIYYFSLTAQLLRIMRSATEGSSVADMPRVSSRSAILDESYSFIW